MFELAFIEHPLLRRLILFGGTILLFKLSFHVYVRIRNRLRHHAAQLPEVPTSIEPNADDSSDDESGAAA